MLTFPNREWRDCVIGNDSLDGLELTVRQWTRVTPRDERREAETMARLQDWSNQDHLRTSSGWSLHAGRQDTQPMNVDAMRQRVANLSQLWKTWTLDEKTVGRAKARKLEAKERATWDSEHCQLLEMWKRARDRRTIENVGVGGEGDWTWNAQQ